MPQSMSKADICNQAGEVIWVAMQQRGLNSADIEAPFLAGKIVDDLFNEVPKLKDLITTKEMVVYLSGYICGREAEQSAQAQAQRN